MKREEALNSFYCIGAGTDCVEGEGCFCFNIYL